MKLIYKTCHRERNWFIVVMLLGGIALVYGWRVFWFLADDFISQDEVLVWNRVFLEQSHSRRRVVLADRVNFMIRVFEVLNRHTSMVKA